MERAKIAAGNQLRWQKPTIVGLRLVQALSGVCFLFGGLWGTTVLLKLTLHEFMMLYGLFGMALPEIPIRLISRSYKKKFRQR